MYLSKLGNLGYSLRVMNILSMMGLEWWMFNGATILTQKLREEGGYIYILLLIW